MYLETQITENKMGVRPVRSLLLTMVLPVMLFTAVQSLYNIVDGIFVEQISEAALSAITYAMPMYTVLTAIGTGIAVGMNTMLSRALGEKSRERSAMPLPPPCFWCSCSACCPCCGAMSWQSLLCVPKRVTRKYWRQADNICRCISYWELQVLRSSPLSGCSFPPETRCTA